MKWLNFLKALLQNLTKSCDNLYPLDRGHEFNIYKTSYEHLIVGNKAEGRISKWVFQEKKVRQIFRKTNIYYPLWKSWLCFLEMLYLRFALLPYYWRYIMFNMRPVSGR